MKNIYDLIKTYSGGKGEAVMWKSVKIISDAVEEHMSDEDKNALARKIYCSMAGGHYNEMFAMEDVAKMYYTDEKGANIFAPYWTHEQVRSVYDTVRNMIPNYNMWDFYVVMNMIKSDNCLMFRKWFPEYTNEQLTEKLVEASVNWLIDDDNPYGTEKVWKYLNK